MSDEQDRGGAPDLDDFFAAARAEAPAPSEALMARLEADALRLRPRPAARPARRGVPSGWRALLNGLGGWPELAGLAAAVAVGIWLGANPPEALLARLDEASPVQSLDPLSGFDYAMLGG